MITISMETLRLLCSNKNSMKKIALLCIYLALLPGTSHFSAYAEENEFNCLPYTENWETLEFRLGFGLYGEIRDEELRKGGWKKHGILLYSMYVLQTGNKSFKSAHEYFMKNIFKKPELTCQDIFDTHRYLGSEKLVDGIEYSLKEPGNVGIVLFKGKDSGCLLYTSPSPRDLSTSRMPSSA